MKRRCDLCHLPLGIARAIRSERWTVHLLCAWNVTRTRWPLPSCIEAAQWGGS